MFAAVTTLCNILLHAIAQGSPAQRVRLPSAQVPTVPSFCTAGQCVCMQSGGGVWTFKILAHPSRKGLTSLHNQSTAWRIHECAALVMNGRALACALRSVLMQNSSGKLKTFNTFRRT
jgi:hypothetical protein